MRTELRGCQHLVGFATDTLLYVSQKTNKPTRWGGAGHLRTYCLGWYIVTRAAAGVQPISLRLTSVEKLYTQYGGGRSK